MRPASLTIRNNYKTQSSKHTSNISTMRLVVPEIRKRPHAPSCRCNPPMTCKKGVTSETLTIRPPNFNEMHGTVPEVRKHMRTCARADVPHNLSKSHSDWVSIQTPNSSTIRLTVPEIRKGCPTCARAVRQTHEL